MVQATLASMRHYCPNVPLCLSVDGDFDVSDLKKQYNLIVLRVSELPSEPMRKLICANYRAKLAVLWEAPLAFYALLDSDAIVWPAFLPDVRTAADVQVFGIDLSMP